MWDYGVEGEGGAAPRRGLGGCFLFICLRVISKAAPASSFLCWASPIPPGSPAPPLPGPQASPASHTEAAASSSQTQAPQRPSVKCCRGQVSALLAFYSLSVN